MENENKKFYELTEEEQKEQMEKFWRKAKPIVKRVLLAIFCIGAILLMVFGLLGSGMFEGSSDSGESHKHAHAIINLLLK